MCLKLTGGVFEDSYDDTLLLPNEQGFAYLPNLHSPFNLNWNSRQHCAGFFPIQALTYMCLAPAMFTIACGFQSYPGTKCAALLLLAFSLPIPYKLFHYCEMVIKMV